MQSENIIRLMRQYAEMPEQAPESQQLREQLVAVQAEVLDIFRCGDARLLAASTLARIDPSQAEAVLPTLIDGLRSSTSQIGLSLRLPAKNCESLEHRAAVDALVSILEIEDENTNLSSCGRAVVH